MTARDSLLGPAAPATVAALLDSVWQLGYLTTDLERAGRALAARLGFAEPIELPSREGSYLAGDRPIDPWRANYAIAAGRDLVVELIEPVSGPAGLYDGLLPEDGSFAVRLHHLAVAVPSGDAEWERLRLLLAASGLGFDYSVDFPGRIRATYVDTSAELGHMVEICQFARETAEFYADLLSRG